MKAMPEEKPNLFIISSRRGSGETSWSDPKP